MLPPLECSGFGNRFARPRRVQVGVQRVPFGAVRRYPCRLVSIDYSTSMHFHGANAGSNPAGDANQFLQELTCAQRITDTPLLLSFLLPESDFTHFLIHPTGDGEMTPTRIGFNQLSPKRASAAARGGSAT